MPKYICYPVRIESTGEIRLFNYEFDQSNMMIEDKILDDIYFKLDREGDYTVLDLFYSDADSPEMVAEDYFATELRKHIQNIYFVGDEYIQQPDKNTISFEFETNLYTVKLMKVRYDWLEGRIHDYYYQVYSYQDGMKSKELVIDGLFTGFDFSAIDELVWGEFEVEIPEFADGGLIAPNGKKSNLTPEQYKLVRTPEFKAWFGFWDLAINGKALDYHIPAVKDIAKRLKLSEPNAIKIAANFLSKQVDSEDVLIPMPSRKGFPTDTNDLAVAIAEMTGAKVFSCLIGKERESVYELKKQGKDVYSFNFQFELRCQFPKAKRYFIVDNVIGTGITMKNALLAIGVNAEPLVYAIDLKNISKVVDNQGEPMVVWHGGTKGINVFENKKGIYFTPFRNIADDFLKYRSGENGKIYDVFLKIKHPKTYDVINYNDIPKSESELNDNDGIIAEYVALEDGTNEGKQFVVFDSNQIKLADGTNTAFDSSNPDIRFAEGGTIKESYELTEENAWMFEYDLAEALGLRPTKSYHLVGGDTLLRIKGHSPNWENFVNDLELNENIDRIINVTVGDYNRRRFDTGLKTKLDEIESRYPDIDFVDIEINDGDDLDLSVAYVRHILYPEMMFTLGGDVQKRKVPKDFDSGDLPEFGQKVKGTDYIYVGHTTTTKFLPEILKHGLKTDAPQKSWDETSKGKIYFEVDPTNHKIYAQRATYRYGGDGVTLIVKVNKNDLFTDRDDVDLGARYKGQKEYYKNVSPDNIVGAWFHFGNIWVKKDDLAEYIRLFHDDDSTFSEGGEIGDNSGYYTIAKHKDIENRTYNGEITIDEFKNAFESALKSEESLKAELEPLKKDELLKLMGSGMFYARYKNEKKDMIISALITDMITFFALGSYTYTFGQDKYEGVKQKVASLTQKSLDDYAAEVAEARRQSQERREKIKAILDNPQTLADFNTFLEYRKKESMTPEQAKLYDELVAQNTKERQEKQAEQKAVVKKVEIGAGVDMNIYETKHTKTGVPLYVVKLSERVDAETYKELNSRAKQLGGYYSSYTRDGAIAGFQFKEKEQAEKFASLKEGDVSNVVKVEERKEEKAGKRADKLRKNAEAIIERVDEELNKDRLTNTAKRAAQATSTESRLHGEKAIAKTMINIADAIDSGQAKYLDLVRTKAQIEQLDAIVKSGHSIYIREKYPDYSSYESHKYDPITEDAVNHIHPMYLFFPRLYTEHWIRAIDKNEDRSGLKNISAKIRKYLGNSEYYQIKNKYELNDFLEFADKIPDSWETNRLKEFAKEHKRLESLGIESDEMLRALLREFILYRGGVEKIDRAKELERKLAGRKVGIDFFPTPKSLAIKMVRMAEVEEGMSILEPSAGNGNIADAIREETGITPDVCEISSELAAILEAKGYTVVATDFMELTEKKYDRIIMNPPFSSRMDAAHVKHAYELLNPNGRIVSIMGEGVFFGSDNAAVSFRDWIDEINGEVEKLPESTFTDKTLYATTGANARLVIINKPAEFGETEPEKEEEKQPETPEIPIPEYEPSLETEIVPEAETTPEPEPIPETKPDVKPEPSAEIPLEERKKQFLEQAMKIINEIPVEKMKEMYNSAMGELLKGEQDKLDNVLSQIAENNDYIEKSRIEEKDKVDREKYALMEKRSLTHAKNKILKSAEIFYTNNVNAIINGGSLLSVTDKLGKESVVADYTKINTADITFTQETILSEERPIYVPVIDEDVFASKGYVFDAIRIGKDNYIMAVNGYKYARSQSRDEILTLSDSEENGFVMLTLDQLVLTNLYYIEKAKAIFQKQADERNADAERRFDNSSDAYKERFLMQKGIYHSLPAKIKKTITQEEYEKLGWQDRVKIDKFLTKRRPKQIVSRLSEDSMWASFHFMYNRFLNPAAIQPAARVANSEVWAYWASFRDFMNFKIKDIQIQREDLSEIRKAALETSFGMSNTNESLKAKYGILVKHQDGSKITPDSITQISVSIHNIYSVFANLKAKAIADTMKVSHTQQRYIFASKAIGVYIPQFATMACSGKFGETEFQCTLAHETAHWIDNLLGRINGKRYATDDYESLAGEIAFGFRKHMNVKSENDYINATKECFARALQQYFAVTVFGDDVETIYSYNLLHNPTPYFTQDNFVGKNYFYSTMKPMIEDFLKENKPLLEENLITDDIDNAPEIEPTIEETKVQEEADEKANRMRMLALKAKADADALALLELEMEMQSGG